MGSSLQPGSEGGRQRVGGARPHLPRPSLLRLPIHHQEVRLLGEIWHSRGQGILPTGLYNLFSGKHFDDITLPSHLKYKDEPFFGWFLFGKPTLAINDAEIIKMMQVKDFD